MNPGDCRWQPVIRTLNTLVWMTRMGDTPGQGGEPYERHRQLAGT
jgi:hypothetical protein